MNFDYTPEQEAVKGMMEEFVEKEVIPFAAQWDKEEKFPWDTVKKMGELGIFGTALPEKYGGSGLDAICHAIVAEQLGRGCSSLRGVYSVAVSLVAKTILAFGTEEQKNKYLPGMAAGKLFGCFGLTEPNSGSDAASMTTTAVEDGDYYVLNGSKMWITNAGIADVALIFAKTDKNAGAKGITAFLVDRDTPGFSTKDIHDKMGLKASNTAEIILDNVRVPKTSMLGGIGKGFGIAMATLDNGRYTVAAGCVGSAQAALDYAKQYAKERIQFGKPIAAHQLVQQLIADMAVDIECGRLLVYKAGHVKNKGQRSTKEVCFAKYYCSEMVNRVAYKAVQVFGGYGFSAEYPVERIYRDARINTLYEGTSQIQQLIIGNFELGVSAFV
ncbi:MAG: Butyrul-CoA dehydrogenase [Firmicutes bacterium]|nr:Butyrul-CoA dehydrogenase [Bacillota bacterium]MDI6705839.1 acyl-CoA dehydrogenase family protein [Bacillota bacterium]